MTWWPWLRMRSAQPKLASVGSLTVGMAQCQPLAGHVFSVDELKHVQWWANTARGEWGDFEDEEEQVAARVWAIVEPHWP